MIVRPIVLSAHHPGRGCNILSQPVRQWDQQTSVMALLHSRPSSVSRLHSSFNWNLRIIPDTQHIAPQDGWERGILLAAGPDHSHVRCDFHPLHGGRVCPVSPQTSSHGRDCVWSTPGNIWTINIYVRQKNQDGDNLLLSWGLQIRRYKQAYYLRCPQNMWLSHHGQSNIFLFPDWIFVVIPAVWPSTNTNTIPRSRQTNL